MLIPVFSGRYDVYNSSVRGNTRTPSAAFSPLCHARVLYGSAIFSDSSDVFTDLGKFGSFVFFLLYELPCKYLSASSAFSNRVCAGRSRYGRGCGDECYVCGFGARGSFCGGGHMGSSASNARCMGSYAKGIGFILLPNVQVFLQGA